MYACRAQKGSRSTTNTRAPDPRENESANFANIALAAHQSASGPCHISDANDAVIEPVTTIVHVVELEVYLRHGGLSSHHLEAVRARLQALTTFMLSKPSESAKSISLSKCPEFHEHVIPRPCRRSVGYKKSTG